MEYQSRDPPAIDDQAQLRPVSSAAVRQEEIYAHLRRRSAENPYDTLNMSENSGAHRRPNALQQSPGGAKRIAVGCARCWATISATACRPVHHPSSDRDRTGLISMTGVPSIASIGP